MAHRRGRTRLFAACGARVDTPLEKPLSLDFRPTTATRAPRLQNRQELSQVGWEPNEPAARAAEELVTRLRREKDDDFIELTANSARPRASAPFVYRPTKFRQSWDPGTVWYHCLIFPRPAWMRVFLIGGLLGLFAAAAPFELRRQLTLDESFGANRWIAAVAIALAGLLVLALISVWFVCILEAERRQVHCHQSLVARVGPAARLGLVVCSALGGPVFLAGVRLVLGSHGQNAAVDQLIIGELLLVMFAYWLFSLAEVSLSPWPRFANPLRVAELVHYLGFRSVILGLLAGGFAWLALLFAMHSLKPIEHNSDAPASFGLAILCIEYGSILLRLTGMWCRMALKGQALALGHDSNSTPGSPVLTSPIK